MEKKIRNKAFAYCVVLILMATFCLPVDLFARVGKYTKKHPNYDKIISMQKHFEARYKKKKPELRTMEFYNNGVLKKLSISGDFTPKGLDTNFKTEKDVRRIVNAFIKKEKKILRLDNSSYSIKEHSNVGIRIREGSGTGILYNIFINGIQYRGGIVDVGLNPKGRVVALRMRLPPDTPEFKEAVARIKTDILSEEELREKVLSQVSGFFDKLLWDTELYLSDKYVIDEAPYAIQEMVYGKHSLKVDLFTGKVIEKHDVIITY